MFIEWLTTTWPLANMSDAHRCAPYRPGVRAALLGNHCHPFPWVVVLWRGHDVTWDVLRWNTHPQWNLDTVAEVIWVCCPSLAPLINTVWYVRCERSSTYIGKDNCIQCVMSRSLHVPWPGWKTLIWIEAHVHIGVSLLELIISCLPCGEHASNQLLNVANFTKFRGN